MSVLRKPIVLLAIAALLFAVFIPLIITVELAVIAPIVAIAFLASAANSNHQPLPLLTLALLRAPPAGC